MAPEEIEFINQAEEVLLRARAVARRVQERALRALAEHEPRPLQPGGQAGNAGDARSGRGPAEAAR